MQPAVTLTPPAPPTASPAVVSARDLVRRYGRGDAAVDALRGVSVDVARSRLTAVMGPSGSGKSTLMHILAGLDKPTSGEVSVAGVDVAGLDDTALTKLRRDHNGFIFQFFNLLPMLTAAENIALPLKLAGGRPEPAWLEELIEKVGLADRRTHRPSELSGDQQQRVAVARALISRPSVMFADEPTGNLDSTTSGEILALLRDSVDSLGQTTVMVTHDAHAAAIADRVLFLADGDIVCDLGRSTAHEILETLEAVSDNPLPTSAKIAQRSTLAWSASPEFVRHGSASVDRATVLGQWSAPATEARRARDCFGGGTRRKLDHVLDERGPVMRANSRIGSFLRELRLPREERAAARAQRRAERARIADEVQRGREQRGEVGKYGAGDNTGYGGSGM